MRCASSVVLQACAPAPIAVIFFFIVVSGVVRDRDDGAVEDSPEPKVDSGEAG